MVERGGLLTAQGLDVGAAWGEGAAGAGFEGAATRTTASPVESESVEEIIGVLRDAGLPVVQAAESCRTLVDLTLAFTQYTAAFRILDEQTQAKDDRAWAVKYATLPAARFPLVHASAARLTELFRNDDEVFELTLATFLDGIEAKLQRAAR